jgi:hypothetical protein
MAMDERSSEGAPPHRGKRRDLRGLPSRVGVVECCRGVSGGGGRSHEFLEQKITAKPSERREWGDTREDSPRVRVVGTEPAHKVENECLILDRGVEVTEGVRHGLHPAAVHRDREIHLDKLAESDVQV